MRSSEKTPATADIRRSWATFSLALRNPAAKTELNRAQSGFLLSRPSLRQKANAFCLHWGCKSQTGPYLARFSLQDFFSQGKSGPGTASQRSPAIFALANGFMPDSLGVFAHLARPRSSISLGGAQGLQDQSHRPYFAKSLACSAFCEIGPVRKAHCGTGPLWRITDSPCAATFSQFGSHARQIAKK